jgi:hypothetical protein
VWTDIELRNIRDQVLRCRAALVIAGFIVTIATHPAPGQVQRVLDDPQSEPGAEFGRALGAVGAELAVGAPGATVSGRERAGRVELFGSGGSLLRTLDALTPVAGAGFGTTVVASDGMLFVAAPGDQPIGLGGVGAVYVFDAATLALIRIVRAPDPDATGVPAGGTGVGSGLPQSTSPRPVPGGFGRALAIDGDRLVVGAPDSTIDGLSGAGAVYVFTLDGAPIRTLQELPARADAAFGAWVAAIGDTLFVGAPGAPAGGVGGAGIVRTFDAATGAPRATLSAPISVTGAEFGAVIGAIGDAVFVAAPGDSARGPDGMGAVYLFNGGTAAVRKVLTPPTLAPQLDFGRAVLAVGDDLLVGADGAGDEQSGEAFLLDPATSALVTRFSPTTERAGGRFGFALAVVGPTIAIGEPAVGSTSTSGRVWLFGTPAGVPSPRGGSGPARTRGVPAAERCPRAATAASIDCRVTALLATVRPQSLARPLRLARRALHRASGARGRRRLRALGRAAGGVRSFAALLRSPYGDSRVPADVRDAISAVSDAVSADLDTLIATPAR